MGFSNRWDINFGGKLLILLILETQDKYFSKLSAKNWIESWKGTLKLL